MSIKKKHENFIFYQVGYLLQYISEHWSTEPVWSGAPSSVEAAAHVDCMMLMHLGMVKPGSYFPDSLKIKSKFEKYLKMWGVF